MADNAGNLDVAITIACSPALESISKVQAKRYNAKWIFNTKHLFKIGQLKIQLR